MPSDNDTRTEFAELVKFANDLAWKQPNIDILRSEFKGKYSFLIEIVQELIKSGHEGRSLVLPNLKAFENQTVAIFTDYGGEHRESRYFTYSALTLAWNLTGSFLEIMKEIRRENQLEDKEISYKDFRMGQLARSLPEYLRALDFLVPRFLLTVAVDKRVLSLFGPGGKETNDRLASELNAIGIIGRKSKVNEKLLRVVELSAFLTALLAWDGQKIFWMTDHDSISPTNAKHEETLVLFGRYLNLFARDNHSFPTVGGALPFAKRSIDHLDLLSVADICAGSISEYLTKMEMFGSKDFKVKAGTHHILQWLAHDGISLKKMNIVIEHDDHQEVFGKTLGFSLTNPPENVTIVPIRM